MEFPSINIVALANINIADNTWNGLFQSETLYDYVTDGMPFEGIHVLLGVSSRIRDVIYRSRNFLTMAKVLTVYQMASAILLVCFPLYSSFQLFSISQS